MYPLEGVETTTRYLSASWAPWRGTFGPPPISGATSTVGGDFFVALTEGGEIKEDVAHINNVRHGLVIYRDEGSGMTVNGLVAEWCNCHATTEAVLAVRARFWLPAGSHAYVGMTEDVMPGLKPVWHDVPRHELVVVGPLRGGGLTVYGKGLRADETAGCIVAAGGDLRVDSHSGRGILRFAAGTPVVLRGAAGYLAANWKVIKEGIRVDGPQFRWGLGEPPKKPQYGYEWVSPTAPWPES